MSATATDIPRGISHTSLPTASARTNKRRTRRSCADGGEHIRETVERVNC